METISNIRKLPGLDEETIHIWGMQVPALLDRQDRLAAVLSRDEQEKAARFRREADRRQSVAARGALRILLAAYTGHPAAQLRFRYSENGKPALDLPDTDPPVAFNVSHSGDWVVLAFGRNRELGVDIERIRRDLQVRRMASRYFTAEESELIHKADDPYAVFFSLWSRKEAYVKAAGSALFRELRSFSVPLAENGLPDLGTRDGWVFQRLEAGSHYAAAVVSNRSFDTLRCFDFQTLELE